MDLLLIRRFFKTAVAHFQLGRPFCSATVGDEDISLKYDPMGNRVWRDSSVAGERKYVVDVASGLPTILVEIDPGTGNMMRTYIHANG